MTDAQWTALVNELANDPLPRGYGGMSDQQIYDSLLATNRDNWIPLTGAQVLEAIDLSELNALAANKRANVDTVLALSGEIELGPGTKARAILQDAFGSLSTTATNLAAVANKQVSRAQELKLIGYITVYRVGQARP